MTIFKNKLIEKVLKMLGVIFKTRKYVFWKGSLTVFQILVYKMRAAIEFGFSASKNIL